MSVRELAAAAALVTTVAVLSGCDQDPTDAEQQAYLESKAKEQTMAQKATEDAELSKSLEELKKADPTVKDAYYSVDENGTRSLHVIRDNPQVQKADNGSSVSDTVWPLLAGVGGGMLLSSMMNSGGVNNYANRYPPASSGYYSRDEEKKRRGTYTSSYVGSMMNSNRSSISRATPIGSPAMKSSVMSTRSTGIWGGGSSSSSARASSHSSSFGG